VWLIRENVKEGKRDVRSFPYVGNALMGGQQNEEKPATGEAGKRDVLIDQKFNLGSKGFRRTAEEVLCREVVRCRGELKKGKSDKGISGVELKKNT